MHPSRLQWHPKFKVYTLENQGVLLNSEKLPLFLSQAKYPNLMGIGSKSPNNSPKDWQLISSFIKQGLLTHGENHHTYVKDRSLTTSSGTLGNHRWVSISRTSLAYQKHWLDLIESIAYQITNPVLFILTDDPLDSRVEELIKSEMPFLLLKVTGEDLWISPLVRNQAFRYWKALQQRILHNAPVLQLIRRLFPEEDHFLPFEEPQELSLDTEKEIKKGLSFQLNNDPSSLLVLPVSTNQLEKHPLQLSYQSTRDFTHQLLQPVILESCPDNFHADGGSRSISPEETVEAIRPFISPICGLITHLDQHKATKNQPVKIFTSAFFQTPSPASLQDLDNSSFVQSCMGKGVSEIQSQASALCEALERYGALYHGNEPYTEAQPNELKGRYYSYQQLAPFSDNQYAKFDDSSDKSLRPQSPKKYDDSSIPWSQVWSLTNKEAVYLPFSTCFRHCPTSSVEFGKWHSNGCAAGNTKEEAILQGLFELLERDAVGLWWYHKRCYPAIDLNLIDPDFRQPLHDSLHPTHHYWVLNLTVDTGVTVAVAIGQNKATGKFSFGFGCHLDSGLAAQRALTELCQLIPIRDQEGAYFNFDAVPDEPFMHPHDRKVSQKALFSPSGDIREDIEVLIAHLETLGLETLVLDYSRDPLPVKTVKVVVPGLCHIWPQFGNPRLYQALPAGDRSPVMAIEEYLNPLPLYI